MGQNARYTFSGTAGQSYSVIWSGSTFSGNSSYMFVHKPNGTNLTYTTFNGAGAASGTLSLTNVPTTGTYTIFVTPYQTATGQITIHVTNP